MKRTMLFAAFAGGLALAPLAAAQADTIRFGYPVQVHGANMMIVQEHAQKVGLDVQPTAMRRYADLQLALTNEDLDMVVFGYVNAGLMEDKGFTNYKAVAGAFVGAQGLTLAKDVEAKKWSDLEGLKIGTAPNSYAELLFKTTAKLNGADLGKIELISFTSGGPPLISALKNGDIDGFVSWEPNGAEAKLGGYGDYSSLDIAANDTRGVNGLVAVRADFAETNPETVVKALKAIVAATDDVNGDLERYVAVARRGTGASEEVIRAAIPRGKLDYRLYQAEAEALFQLIHQAGITKSDASPSVAQRFDYQYLEKATGKGRQELGGK